MEGVRFVYGKPVAILDADMGALLVVGDLHIGIERTLANGSVHFYNAADRMGKEISGIADEFGVRHIAILGDVKDSVLYPDRAERGAIQRFFAALGKYEIVLLRGNHDAHIEEVVDIPVRNEAIVGHFALVHGNGWPSDRAMRCDAIFTAHNHMALVFDDEMGGHYREKAWLIAGAAATNARRRYPNYNRKIKLVMMPAFNEFITGSLPVVRGRSGINPLLRNRIFDYGNGMVYTLRGDMAGSLKSLAKRSATPTLLSLSGSRRSQTRVPPA